MPLRARARVDLDAIERNCRLLDAAAGPAKLCAVVKSDGYGHGAVPAARAAVAGGATWIGVATANEAAALRDAGIETRLLVLGALSPEELDVALHCGADVVAWSTEFAAAVVARGGTRAHVKLDSGMGRLGTRDPAEADAVIEALGDAVVGLMSHFATADDRADPFMDEQNERFRAWAVPWKAKHPDLVLHTANSAATLRSPATRYDMVRCGIAIYGMDPFGVHPDDCGLSPALTLTSYVAAVKPIDRWQSAGYGRRFIAREPTTLATIPIGYGDGYRRSFTNNADVLIGGERYPLVGTVSMDNITVDLGPSTDVRVGDEVVLLGGEITAEELARRIDTINYEITCAISQRVPRVYA
jgi:alanine racemase